MERLSGVTEVLDLIILISDREVCDIVRNGRQPLQARAVIDISAELLALGPCVVTKDTYTIGRLIRDVSMRRDAIDGVVRSYSVKSLKNLGPVRTFRDEIEINALRNAIALKVGRRIITRYGLETFGIFADNHFGVHVIAHCTLRIQLIPTSRNLCAVASVDGFINSLGKSSGFSHKESASNRKSGCDIS